MNLNKKLPKWVFILTVVISVAIIALIAWQSVVILTDIRQTGESIAEIGKDYRGADKHRLERLQRLGFCGQETNGPCDDDSDCIKGGCSGQICQSKNEEPITTTCEYRDCYNAEFYDIKCKCVNNKCKWSL